MKSAVKPDPSLSFKAPPMEHVTTARGCCLKFCGGFWVAATDTSILRFLLNPNAQVLGRGTYQFRQLNACLKLIPKERRRVAIDIGAHVGTWTRILAGHFQGVIAVEPLPIHQECLAFNVPSGNVRIVPYAMSDAQGDVPFFNDTVKGIMSRIAAPGKPAHFNVHAERLDDILRYEERDKIDFIKIDVEGHELRVIKGGEKTIRDNRPFIIVEQKDLAKDYDPNEPRFATVALLQKWGAKLLASVGDDRILGWR